MGSCYIKARDVQLSASTGITDLKVILFHYFTNDYALPSSLLPSWLCFPLRLNSANSG